MSIRMRRSIRPSVARGAGIRTAGNRASNDKLPVHHHDSPEVARSLGRLSSRAVRGFAPTGATGSGAAVLEVESFSRAQYALAPEGSPAGRSPRSSDTPPSPGCAPAAGATAETKGGGCLILRPIENLSISHSDVTVCGEPRHCRPRSRPSRHSTTGKSRLQSDEHDYGRPAALPRRRIDGPGHIQQVPGKAGDRHAEAARSREASQALEAAVRPVEDATGL